LPGRLRGVGGWPVNPSSIREGIAGGSRFSHSTRQGRSGDGKSKNALWLRVLNLWLICDSLWSRMREEPCVLHFKMAFSRSKFWPRSWKNTVSGDSVFAVYTSVLRHSTRQNQDLAKDYSGDFRCVKVTKLLEAFPEQRQLRDSFHWGVVQRRRVIRDMRVWPQILIREGEALICIWFGELGRIILPLLRRWRA
jgi:hypothetical protein